MKLLVALLVGASGVELEPLEGSLFFTNLSKGGELLRVDCGAGGCGAPRTIATGVETYTGLVPWKGRLLAALNSHQVVQLDPWCRDSSCPATPLVDVGELLGLNSSFRLGGMARCHDSLYLVFGGGGASGVLRCDCAAGDCASSCSLVDGWSPGRGARQLSSFAAGIACAGERVLVADNTNFRVQALPVSCGRAPCEVTTLAKDLKWPLGIAVVGGRVLVTLDEGIEAVRADGSHAAWSSMGDAGFLCQGAGRILVASGGDGHVLSFDPACERNCTGAVVWSSTGTTARAGGAIAYMARRGPRAIVV